MRHVVAFSGAWLTRVILLAGLCAGSTSMAASTTPTKDAANPVLQRFLAGFVKQGAPSAYLFVGTTGRVAVQAAGQTSKTGKRLDIDQVWRIASVTKMVTAAIIMQLAREGKLTLDDPLAKHLPAVVPGADRITVRQLLNHTSGVADYLAVPGSPLLGTSRKLVANLRQPRSYEASLALARQHSSSIEPGQQHEYSNTNYLLLGRIIEKTEGRSYSHVVTTRVIEPLGLLRTGFPAANGKLPPSHLKAYLRSDGAPRASNARARSHDVTEHTFFLGADGGLYTSGPDLVRLLEAFWRGELLTDQERQMMIADMVEDHDGNYRYGLGVAAYPTRCGEVVFGHEGNDLGSFTMALTNRSRSRHVVLVLNRSTESFKNLETALFNLRSAAFCAAK